MAQVPGIGLDQSQLADVINQQYKGYSQKQRNQMMQSAAATPDNWSSITQQSNQQAQQPSEYLGAGRTSNIPNVSYNGQKLTGYDEGNLGYLSTMNSGYSNADFDYKDTSGKGYFLPETQNKIESQAPNFLSGWFGAYNNPSGNYTEHRAINPGGYYYADPWGFSHSVSKVGNNKFFVPESTLNEHTRSGTADTWYGINPSADLSGLQYGQYNGQGGLFFDPSKTNLSSLLTPQRNNSAYAEKKSGGIGSFAGDIMKIADPGSWYAHGGDDYFNAVDEKGLYSALFNNFGADGKGLNSALDTLDPMHDTGQNAIADVVGADSQEEAFNMIAPTLVNMFAPYGAGYLINAGNQANQGNTTGALTNLASYGMTYLPTATPVEGSGSTGIYGSGNSLGSVAADKAAQSFINSTAMNMVTNGGDIGNALKSAAFSTASGALGGAIGDRLSPQLGEIAGKALGGAASGGLNSLFTGNSPVRGSLYGAMSGGLHGFLNSTNRDSNTYSQKQDTSNRQTAQNVTKLAKLFTKK